MQRADDTRSDADALCRWIKRYLKIVLRLGQKFDIDPANTHGAQHFHEMKNQKTIVHYTNVHVLAKARHKQLRISQHLHRRFEETVGRPMYRA